MKLNAFVTLASVAVLSSTGTTEARLGGKDTIGRSLAESNNESAEEEIVYRWASTGGGWLAMSADMAFANVFAQAGVIDDTSSAFTAVSTESGGTWFSTQFFYSPQFHSNVTGSSPDQLSAFLTQWMRSYAKISSDIKGNPICSLLATRGLSDLISLCNVLVDFEGNWANFVDAMMRQVSEDYGDSGFVDRAATPENRVTAMSETDLYIQMLLAANSRLAGSGSTNEGSYFGPSGTEYNNEVFSVPLTFQYSISDNNTQYYSSGPTKNLEIDIYTGEMSNEMGFPNGTMAQYGLYPEPASTLIGAPSDSTKAGSMPLPFGGEPNIVQLASASSAAAAALSPLIPSSFSQLFSSVEVEDVKDQEKFAHTVNDLFSDKYGTSKFMDEFSVCSQWPNDCSKKDGRLLDGGYGDAATLALNLGQYQERGSLNKTLKYVVTEVSGVQDPSNFLAYFETTFNKNVAPGDSLWRPDAPVPLQSPQVFETYLDESSLNLKNVTGTDVATTVVSTTTVDNPAYHVKGGQKVEILVLWLVTEIPVVIVGDPSIEKWTPPLVDMVEEIAANKELVNQVKSFFSA